MAIKEPGKRPTYRLTDEFKFEDMFAALNNFGIVSESEIERWRAEKRSGSQRILPTNQSIGGHDLVNRRLAYSPCCLILAAGVDARLWSLEEVVDRASN